MAEKNKVTASILGKEYTFVGIEDKEYLEKVCSKVNEIMKLISKDTSLKPIKVSVLTAINLCDELIKAQDRLKSLSEENLKLTDEIESLKQESEIFEQEKKYLKNERQNLRKSK